MINLKNPQNESNEEVVTKNNCTKMSFKFAENSNAIQIQFDSPVDYAKVEIKYMNRLTHRLQYVQILLIGKFKIRRTKTGAAGASDGGRI